MGGRTRVLIADDRSRSRKGLRALLSTNAQLKVVGEAKNGKEAVELRWHVAQAHVRVV